MKYLLFCSVAFLLTTIAYGQKMNIGESQRDFHYLVTGTMQVNGKWVSIGLQTRPEAMDSLIADLRKEYQNEIKIAPASDSMKLVLVYKLCFCYNVHPLLKQRHYSDSVVYFARQQLILARKLKEVDMVVRAYINIWNQYQYRIPDPTLSLSINLLKEWISDYDLWIRDIGISDNRESPHILLADLYVGINDDESAESTIQNMLEIARKPTDKWLAYSWFGDFYLNHEKKKEALHYMNEVVSHPPSAPTFAQGIILAETYRSMVKIMIDNKDYENAMSFIPNIDVALNCNNCFGSQNLAEEYDYYRNILTAEIYLSEEETENALIYLQKLPDMENGPRMNEKIYNPDFDRLWYLYYKQKGESDKALAHIQKYVTGYDSIQHAEAAQKIIRSKKQFSVVRSYEELLLKEKANKVKMLDEQRLLTVKKQNEIERMQADADKRTLLARASNADLRHKIETDSLQNDAKKKKLLQDYHISSLNQDIKVQQRTRILLLSGLTLFVFFASVLFYQNRRKQKVNKLLASQKGEIESQRDKLTNTLKELNETQAQLIQSEKMASLGELTAGIAHEIQNPLNFVNNFSEINTELISELEEERKKEIRDFANEDDILKSIKENEQKINHHGKRADAIVKGMLQHSRTSSGVKQPTDINALADEYLRLSYHGLRAKDKSFNATMKTEFDESIGKIDLVSQDIGRVVLNLITNAFYAVNEKSKESQADPVEAGYEPLVVVSTKKLNNKIEISVKDNGNGIPESIKEKIYQPFFTTKPTGQGTGLGLSLSYDIVKAHGGELKSETKEGEGTVFTIEIPLK